jgi:hypothetical protein
MMDPRQNVKMAKFAVVLERPLSNNQSTFLCS